MTEGRATALEQGLVSTTGRVSALEADLAADFDTLNDELITVRGECGVARSIAEQALAATAVLDLGIGNLQSQITALDAKFSNSAVYLIRYPMAGYFSPHATPTWPSTNSTMIKAFDIPMGGDPARIGLNLPAGLYRVDFSYPVSYSSQEYAGYYIFAEVGCYNVSTHQVVYLPVFDQVYFEMGAGHTVDVFKPHGYIKLSAPLRIDMFRIETTVLVGLYSGPMFAGGSFGYLNSFQVTIQKVSDGELVTINVPVVNVDTSDAMKEYDVISSDEVVG